MLRRNAFLLCGLFACGSRTALDALPIEVPLDAGEEASMLFDSGRLEMDSGGPGLDAGCNKPAWLVFELSGPGGGSLYAMRADGTEGHALILAGTGGTTAAFSRDGTQLLYVGFSGAVDGGTNSTLFLEQIATGATRSITSALWLDTLPGISYSAFSPDELTIAYTVGYDVHTIDVDGTHDSPLLVSSSDDIPIYGHPSFSNDSQTVFYGSSQAFGSISVSGSDLVTLVTEAGFAPQFPNPALSPDGTRIASVVQCGADFDSTPTLRVFELASLPAPCGSGRVVATTANMFGAPNGSANPEWGPTGLIAYGSGTDVYVVDPDGGAPRNMSAQLVSDGGMNEAFDPIWAPGCAPMP